MNELGLKIPEQLFAIGFDTVVCQSIRNPKLTTARHSPHRGLPRSGGIMPKRLKAKK